MPIEKYYSNFRDHYHDLIALGEQFIVHLFDFRRGQEGAQKIPKDGWELKEHEGKKAYIKVFSEETKTRKDDVEDEDDFGILPNIDMTNGFNPMVYHGLYLKLLNPKNKSLFQRVVRDGEGFDIHDLKRKCLFENSPRGKHKISQMLRILCGIVGKPGLGNHSLRATGVCLLKEDGWEDRIIKMFTSMFSFNSTHNLKNLTI